MPTTTNYGWTTPADTDLVKDGASAIRTLGTAIDTTVFNNASAGIAKTIVDAKGDIIAATAADTVARLAVGANNTVLTADSAEATGLKWAAPASALPANATASVAAQEVTTSTSYTDLATAGPAVTLTTGTKALIIVTAIITGDLSSNFSYMGYAVSGATTISATDSTALQWRQGSATGTRVRSSAASIVTLTAGSNTFTAKYRADFGGNNASFETRSILVINMA